MALNNCYQRMETDVYNDCRDSYGKGLAPRAYYVARDDIDFNTSTIDGNVITKLALDSGAKAVRFNMPSRTPYNGAKNEDQNAAIGIAVNKTVPIILLADSPENARKIETLKSQQGVVIVENNAKGDKGKQAFVVVGWEQGVYGQNAIIDKYSDDTQGGWSIDLIEEGAKTPQIFLWMTDYETTKKALESMCNAE